MSEQLAENLSGVLPLSDDLIWGIRDLAKELGKTERQTFHLVETKQIPAGKVGGRIVSSKTKLRAHFEALTSGEAV